MRNLSNILSEYEELTEKGIRVVCREPHFQNFNERGEEDIFSKLLLSLLGSVGAYEKSLIKRQLEGIRLAKLMNPEKYSGRKQNTKESKLKFLQKHSKAVEYLERGMKGVEVSKLCGISLNTITKIKKKHSTNIKSMNKKRRKELRNIYEYINGVKYVEEIKKQPSVSWFDWVGIKSKS